MDRTRTVPGRTGGDGRVTVPAGPRRRDVRAARRWLVLVVMYVLATAHVAQWVERATGSVLTGGSVWLAGAVLAHPVSRLFLRG